MPGQPRLKVKTMTTIQPCPTEDSTDCYWDALYMGDGHGTSFLDYNGEFHQFWDQSTQIIGVEMTAEGPIWYLAPADDMTPQLPEETTGRPEVTYPEDWPEAGPVPSDGPEGVAEDAPAAPTAPQPTTAPAEPASEPIEVVPVDSNTPDGPPVTPQEPEVIPTPASALPEPTEQAPPAAEQAIPTVDAPATDIGTPTMSLISYLESTEAQVSTTQPTGELAPVPDALSSWLIAGGFIVAGLIMVANDWLKARK